jgi:hypothetical protein
MKPIETNSDKYVQSPGTIRPMPRAFSLKLCLHTAFFAGTSDVAPTDGIRLPFRWQFIPVENALDGAIIWKWHAYTHTGELAMESETAFDTLSECKDNARREGYEGH